MIVNFRYHIFTITAIFAALGLGILIGSSIIGHEGVVQEQKKIIEDIGVSLKRMRTENYKLEENMINLQSELDYRTKLEQQLFSLAMKNFPGEKIYYLISDENLKDSFKKKLKVFFQEAGTQIKFGGSSQNLQKLDGFNRIILWGMDKKERDLIDERLVDIDTKRVINYNNIKKDYNLSSNFVGLVLALLESEFDERGK